MNNRNAFDDLEFENPVEIRKIEEEPPKKGKLVYLIIIFILLAITTFLGYREFTRKQEINKLKTEIETLNKKLKEREEKLTQISEKLDKIQSVFSKTSKNKKELLNNISFLENEVKKQKRNLKKLSSRINTLKKEIKRLKSENKKLKSEKAKYKKLLNEKEKTITQKENKIKELENKLAQQSVTLKNLRETFSMESNASKKLISELIDEQKKNQKLLEENLKLKESIKSLKNKIKKLENVDEGDLVPSSELLTLAKPLVNPAVKVKSKGLFSKIKGFVVVNALIDEYGTVKNAYFVSTNIPEDKINRGILINKTLTTIKKWKFSPPLYKGKIAVKTWQPVVVPVSSE